MAIAVLVPLLDPKNVAVRLLSLVIGGLFLADAARKTKWATEPNIELHLLNPREVNRPWRKKLAFGATASLVFLYAFISWPKPEIAQRFAVPVTIDSPGPPVSPTPALPHPILPVVVGTKPPPSPVKIPKPPQKAPSLPPVIPPDPYFGTPDETVRQWALREADRIEAMGKQCDQDLMDAVRRKNQGPPIVPLSPGPEGVQGRFWQDFNSSLEPGLIKLHDSITFRLGPAELDAREEQDYHDVMDYNGRPQDAWPLCEEVQTYAGDLRQMANALNSPH